MKQADFMYGKSKYIVYEDGRVYSDNMSRFLPSHSNNKEKSNSYQVVNLWSGKRARQFYVHRLVALCFLPNDNNLPDVNHIDMDKTNNNLSNLEWMSRKENLNHARDNGAFKAVEEQTKINQLEWIGQRLGTRVVVGVCDEKNKVGNYKVMVQCDCGNILKAYYNDFKKNKHDKCAKCRKRKVNNEERY